MLVRHTDSCIVTVMPMKKLLPLLIILLLLAGCGEIPEPKTVTVTLPVPTGPTAPQLWSYSPPKSQSPFDLISIRLALHAEPDGLLYISGPAGTVAAKPFGESLCLGSAIGDVDRDGEAELVYICPQEDFELLCVYGLEDGWPVCKGSAALKPEPPGQFFPVESSLETIDGKVVYHACLEHWVEESQDWIPDSRSSLAVVLEDGQLRLEGAGKTAGISCTGVPGDYFGASFSALSQQLGENALLRSRSCLVWMEHESGGREDAAAELIRTWAVLTDNGVTVTGLLTLEQRPDGGFTEAVNGFEPIAPLSNPANLAASSVEKLETMFGPCHFDMGDDVPIPCWFTRNYKLLIVNFSSYTVEVLDLRTGEAATYESDLSILGSPCQLGASFSKLSRQVGEDAVFSGLTCLIWQGEALPNLSSRSPEELLSDPSPRIPFVCAALSDGGETVTGLITWTSQGDGSWTCASEGIEPIEPVDDPSALEGLSAEALEEQLGPCHFDMGSGLFIPCWFTRDGKLIVFHRLSSLSFNELLPLDPDTVSPDEPYRANLARWDAFLEKTARGEPDTITLRLDASDKLAGTGVPLPAYLDLLLAYNGEVYEVAEKVVYASSKTAGDRPRYSYLIAEVETEPSPWTIKLETGENPSPAYIHPGPQTHYLLSDDPDMTYRRYLNNILSSISDPDFPNTMLLFSLDHRGEVIP